MVHTVHMDQKWYTNYQTSESTIFFLANGIGSGRRPDSAAGLSRKFNHSLSRMTKSWRKSEWNIKQIGIWQKLLKWLNKIEKDEDLDGFELPLGEAETSPKPSSFRAVHQYPCLPKFVIQVSKNTVVKGLRRSLPPAVCGVSFSKVIGNNLSCGNTTNIWRK